MGVVLTTFIITVVLVTCRCPNRWGLIDNDCVYFSPNALTWSAAEAECRSRGGYLATDDSAEKHKIITYVANLLLSHHDHSFWLGATDYAVEGQWRWLENGEDLSGLNVTHWDVGFPTNNKSLNCLGAHWNHSRHLVWRQDDCSFKQAAICEKPQHFPTTLPPLIVN